MSVHLSRAVLCVNCEVISGSAGECCMHCGSPSLISLSKVLNRAPAKRKSSSNKKGPGERQIRLASVRGGLGH